MGWAFMLFPFLLSLFAPSIRKPSYSRFVSRWDAAWRPQRFGRDPSRVPRSDPYPYDDLQRWLERKQQQQSPPFGAGTFRDNHFDPGPDFSDSKTPATWGKERFLNDRFPTALARHKPSNQRYEKFPSPFSNLPNHRPVHGSNRPLGYGHQAADPYRKTFEALIDMVQNRLLTNLLQRLWSQHQGQAGNGASPPNSVVQPARFPSHDRQALYGNKLQTPPREFASWRGSSSRPNESAGKDKVKIKWSRPKVLLSKMAPSGGRQQHGSRGPSGTNLYSGYSGGTFGSRPSSAHSGGTSGKSLYSMLSEGTSGNGLYSGHSGGTSAKGLYSGHSGGTADNSLYSGRSGGSSGNSLHSRPSGGAPGNSLYPGYSGYKQPGNPESNAIYPLAFRKTREEGNRKMH
ncbi:Hypp4405 [Branchiostoma lanceolatum]|uniref:Hypp4405 protein n=1 Tax=Branchiostoma lanceolatum TaxID=7740 RepID=A0A8K0AAB2_BRALA|nr:Hypp4405 [Branchiostoma lanceolatum]